MDDKDFEVSELKNRLKTLEIDMAFLKRTVEKLHEKPNEVHYHYETRIDNLYASSDFDTLDFDI